MKKLPLLLGLIFVIILSASIFIAFQMGQKPTVIAAGDIALDESLVKDAQGIRTLFITVFDPESPAPMPLGAMRENLSSDAVAGVFQDFILTPERVRMMNPNAPMPAKLRIKVRLDRDGMGGSDSSGDLTGEVNPIAFGSEGVRITIANKVP